MKHRSSGIALLFSLAGPLLLSACVSQSQFDVAMNDNTKLREQNQQLTQQNLELNRQLLDERAHVSRLQDAVKYTVNSDLLFPSGGWQLSAAGQEVIAKMAKVLAAEQQDKIVVTGYTDDNPVGAGLRQQGITSNQILSQKRAETVMQYMISQGVNPSLVTARGFGQDYPVVPNTSAQARAQNRRVEITLAGPGS